LAEKLQAKETACFKENTVHVYLNLYTDENLNTSQLLTGG